MEWSMDTIPVKSAALYAGPCVLGSTLGDNGVSLCLNVMLFVLCRGAQWCETPSGILHNNKQTDHCTQPFNTIFYSGC